MKLFKSHGDRGNFKEASIQAFYALENLGESHVELRREQHQTAREYGNLLVDQGYTSQEEIEPIILNFEIAKYSEMNVGQNEYNSISQSLDTVAKKLKSGKSSVPKSKRTRGGAGGKRKARRRKPTRGGKTGAARRRRGATDDE